MGATAERRPTETTQLPDTCWSVSFEMCSGASPDRTSLEALDRSKPGQVNMLTKVSLSSGFALHMYAKTLARFAPAANFVQEARAPTENASAQTVATVRNRC